MRPLVLFATLAGALLGHSTAHAQASGAGAAGADFSGIYEAPAFVAVVAVTGPDVYPFTEEGRRAFDAYDPLVHSANQADDCTADLMPGILWSNSPMEIVQEEDRVVIRFERGNTTRSIPVDGPPPPPDQPRTDLGYSVAHWAGDVLSIETTHMTGDVVRNNRGYAMSPQARVTERYWREPGENDLQMELLVEDPVNYTEPFTLGREWIWAPAEQLHPYECVSLGPRDEPPDIDELARMLEEL